MVRIKDGFYLGGISFYRNIAESLGYIVGAPTKPKDDRLNAYYELPITGIRPGFGNNVEAPIRADANSEEGETIPQIDHEIMDFARHPEHFSAEQQAEMFKKRLSYKVVFKPDRSLWKGLTGYHIGDTNIQTFLRLMATCVAISIKSPGISINGLLACSWAESSQC